MIFNVLFSVAVGLLFKNIIGATPFETYVIIMLTLSTASIIDIRQKVNAIDRVQDKLTDAFVDFISSFKQHVKVEIRKKERSNEN